MVLYHWSQSTRLVREGALGPLSFIYERQYTEQFVDNQQEQKTVNLAELKHFKPKCLEAPITGASKLFVHTSSDTELMKSMMSSYDRLLLVKALMSSSV